MAEIKSAIEIAMEELRVRPFVEKREMKEEEFQSKAHALVNRFLEVDLHSGRLKKSWSRYSSGQRIHWKIS